MSEHLVLVVVEPYWNHVSCHVCIFAYERTATARTKNDADGAKWGHSTTTTRTREDASRRARAVDGRRETRARGLSARALSTRALTSRLRASASPRVALARARASRTLDASSSASASASVRRARRRRRRARASSESAFETEEYCALVNERNEVIGSATRRETVSSRALGRGAFGVVLKRAPVDARARDDGSASTSASDTFTALVTRRSARKDVWPNALDAVTSGVCQRDDASYETTMRRELEEELGVGADDVVSLTRMFTFPYEDRYMRVWGACFEIILRDDAEVAYVDGEVQTGAFERLDDLAVNLRDGREGDKFTPIGKYVLRSYLAYKSTGTTPPSEWDDRHVEE